MGLREKGGRMKFFIIISAVAVSASMAFANAGLPQRQVIQKDLIEPVRMLSFTVKDLESFSGNSKKDLETYAYNTIASIEVTDITNKPEPKPEAAANDFADGGIGVAIMVAKEVIAFGKDVWKIVEAGRPVVSVDMAPTVSVLPNSGSGTAAIFREMEGWSAPHSWRYEVAYKNLMGMTVIKFNYTVHFQPRGTYQKKGAYLTGINVEASDVEVLWGFTFDAKSNLISITNRGSSDDPVASATLRVSYEVKTVLQEIRASETFHVMGNGRLIKL